uniref:Uncharacterized protein n=1 Tax=Trypanosoma congolense (strain IL3000) TaxID=1068625 RepID=G0V0Y9_TRYCI|nr:hypothetical protein, unlikely [Trypanosoma congolense IL3000]
MYAFATTILKQKSSQLHPSRHFFLHNSAIPLPRSPVPHLLISFSRASDANIVLRRSAWIILFFSFSFLFRNAPSPATRSQTPFALPVSLLFSMTNFIFLLFSPLSAIPMSACLSSFTCFPLFTHSIFFFSIFFLFLF